MKVLRIFLVVFFVIAGSAHFIIPDAYLTIVPPFIPFPLIVVYVSGFFEILFGILCLFDRYLKVARWGLILLLIAVFPANIYMVLNKQQFNEIEPWLLYLRLPFQLLLIYWVYISTIPYECRRKKEISL